jgi:dihydropteroate synthase
MPQRATCAAAPHRAPQARALACPSNAARVVLPGRGKWGWGLVFVWNLDGLRMSLQAATERVVARFGKVVDAACRARGAALMGVLNVTPDSFYDGGRYCTAEAATARVTQLVGQGADIIDIGGESSRPGAAAVEPDEQLARVEPALRFAVGQRRSLVSVDTTSPEVAERVLELGADVINDVSCLANVELARVVARRGAALIIMHTRGPLGHMNGFSQYPDDAYHDVVKETLMEWTAARDRASQAGMDPDDILLDPGVGFAKNARHSFEVLRRLGEFRSSGARIVVGPSRKSFIAAVDPSPPEHRLGGTIAACVLCAQRGASVLRVHDVAAVRQALAVASAAEPSAGWREQRHA